MLKLLNNFTRNGNQHCQCLLFILHYDFWLIAILQFNSSLHLNIQSKWNFTSIESMLKQYLFTLSFSLSLSARISSLTPRRKPVCFYIESHWIWFAIHLNGFHHVSSPLGIGKSTGMTAAQRTERTNEPKCNANMRDIALTS